MFAGALAGLVLQRLLPRHHLSPGSQDVVKLGAGVIATVTALVLGLLISSAKGTFDEASSKVTQAGAKVVMLDELLDRYGPETKPVREQLRRSVERILGRIWPSEATAAAGGMAAVEQSSEIRHMQDRLGSLAPSDDAHRQILAQAQQVVSDVGQARWMLIEEAQNALPTALLVVLIFWLAVLFSSFGLSAPQNGTVIVVLFVCACSMAGAIFLILELNHPLDGFIKVSSAPLRKALLIMGR
jgi:hypothetical protein